MTVKVNNKSYTFKFTIWTIERVCELQGIELDSYDDFMNNNQVKGILTVFRAALERGSEGKQVLGEFEMDNLIEQMSKEDFLKIYKTYLDGMEQIAIKVSGLVEVKKN